MCCASVAFGKNLSLHETIRKYAEKHVFKPLPRKQPNQARRLWKNSLTAETNQTKITVSTIISRTVTGPGGLDGGGEGLVGP